WWAALSIRQRSATHIFARMPARAACSGRFSQCTCENRPEQAALAGMREYGIDCDVIVEKQMAKRAATELARSPASIAQAIKGFGNALEGPWRADEKAAATAAWLALTRPAP